MAGKDRIIRGLTCFTAAASLVLATVPAYAETRVPSEPAQQDATHQESKSVEDRANGVGTETPPDSDLDISVSQQPEAVSASDSSQTRSRKQRPDVSRLGGQDAVDTSIVIARHAYPDPPGTVYLASVETLIDAFAAGSLQDGPVVFTYGNRLPDVVKRYLLEVNPEKVIALGGPRAIQPQVLQQARVSNQQLGRLAGPVAADTAVAIAKYAYPNGSSRVYVTNGFLSGSKISPDPIAGMALRDGPILFGTEGGITANTRNAISSLGAKEVVQLGYRKLGTYRPDRYLAGGVAFDTSVEISKEVLKRDVHIGYLTNVNSLMDGIPAGSLDDGSILLSYRDVLPYQVCEHIRTSEITKVVALGGPAAISEQVLKSANNVARDKSAKCQKPAPPAPAVGWRPPARYLQPVSAIRAPGTTVVPRRGWNGTKVREVRARMGVGVPLNSGMTFDGRTENAVKRFQRRIRVRANGVVDYQTWVRMTSRSWTMDNFRMTPMPLSANRNQRLNAMLSFARGQIGSPYTWGGAGGYGDGYDCSGLALQAIYRAGLDPQPINVISHAAPSYRSSKELYAHPRLQKVGFGSRQPGDLVFWQGRGGIYHVAIYLGSNQIIESNYGHARQRGLYNWGSIAPYVVRPLAS